MHYQQRNDLKTFAQILFWISFLLLIVASTSVLALEAPETLIEGETLTVTWNQSSGTAYSLEREGAQVATQSPYEWQTQSGDAGDYIFSLYENASFVATTTVEVIENTINFTIVELSSETYTTNTIPIELQTHSPVDFCYYVLESESKTLAENDGIHTGDFTRDDGIYTIELKCKSGSEITSKEKTILIDSTPPEILEKKPTGTITDDKATISVTTDEIASCSYKRTGDAAEETPLSTDDKLTHTATITQSGQNNLEITCSDAYANEGTENLEFSLKTPPSATIEIEDAQDYEIDGTVVLTAGSYPVTLTASEEIQEANLRYEFQGGGSSTVALSKDDDAKTWEGFLSIPESAGEKAASFEVELENSEGVKGTKITQGKLFLVDTIAPEQVQNPKAERVERGEQNYIRLSWSDNQDVKYNVYRSTIDRVSDGDYLAQTSANFYEDRGVEEESRYYYVIAAEDEAGNVGEPSRIITPSGTIRDPSDTQNDSRSQASNEKLKKAILDLETAKKSLENERNEEKLTITLEVGLLKKIDDLLSELKTYEERPSEKEGIEEAITKVNKVLPTRIEIDAQIDYEQDTDSQSQNSAIAQSDRFFGEGASILGTTRQKSEYQTATQQLNDEVKIESRIITATVTFADRSTQGYTHVSRQLTVPMSTKAITIVEKPFASPEELQTIASKNGDFLKIEIPSGESSATYTYLAEESVDLATARSAKAVALPGLPDPSESANSITGQVFNTQITDFSWTYIIGIVMIAGLTIYYFVTPAAPSSVDQLTNALTQVLQKQSSPSPRNYFSSTPQQFYKRRKPESRPTRVFPSQQSPQSFFERKSLKNENARSISGSSPLEKIRTAHEHIDQKEYIPARNIYQDAMGGLHDFSQEEKESVNELYYKIMLYQTVQKALESAERKDADRLSEQLKVLQGVAQKVPESQTALISDAKAIYAELNEKMNRLVIEQENL